MIKKHLKMSLEAPTETQDKVKGGLLLDVVISKGPAILQLLPCKDQPLLVRWDALLVLNFGLHIVNGVRALHLKGNGLTRKSLNENLHSSPETKDKVKGRLLLNVIVSKGPTILKLLPSEDQPLLVRGNTLLVLDLRLHVVNSVRTLHLKGNGLTSEGLHKDLHTTTKTQHQVES